MYLVKNLSTDPYFNMASEEYFLDRFEEEFILLWRNDRTVVVGKHQNTAEEVDAEFVKKNSISVVRRLSGGGAVFHDLGNINYTVIGPYQEGLFSNYGHFTEPVCAYLKTLGVDARLSGRNDLLIDGMKCCGNAQTKRGDRLMHHGCILFSADVADLSGALTPGKLKIESKSVKSVRSRVTNIASHLDRDHSMSSDEFFDGLFRYFLDETEGAKEYILTEKDREAIAALAKEKYETWEWNYGSSPAFEAKREQRFPFGIVDVRFTVKDGRISGIKFYGDFFGMKDTSELEALLEGNLYEQESLREALSSTPIGEYISGMTAEELADLLLGN